MKKLTFLPFYFFFLLLASCELDSYDKGDGEYSQMQADFAELTVNSEKQGVSILTDEGEQLTLTTPVTAKWLQRPDTVYRAIVYYNKVETDHAELLALGQMAVLQPVEHYRFKEQPQDPLGVETMWLTKNKKYINLGLLLKNGQVGDEEGTHALALCSDTVLLNKDQTRTAHYRLLHSQGNAPEYYTNRRYVSILIPQEERPDSIRLTIQTYNGRVEKRFALQ